MNSEAVRQSRVLDDGAGELNRNDPVHRVHEALQRSAASRVRPAPAELRARVMSEVRSGGRTRRESTGLWWGLALAANLALAAGLSWWAPWQGTSAVRTASTATLAESEPPSTFAVASITELPALTAPTIERTLQEPLLREARAIRADTERAAASILSHIPIPGAARAQPVAAPAGGSVGAAPGQPRR